MFGPLFGRYPPWFFTVRTRKRPLNICTLNPEGVCACVCGGGGGGGVGLGGNA